MKVKEIIKLLEDDGWYMVRMKGSHRQFKHPSKQGTVTVAGKPNGANGNAQQYFETSWVEITWG